MRQEYFHNLRVKLPPGKTLDFFASSCDGQRLAVGTVGDHGVERIGHGKYTGAYGDLIALQTARISRAVVTFLMRQNNFGGFFEEGNTLENRETDIAVATHDFALFRGEWAGLGKNAVRHPHFADVVKKSAAGDVFQMGLINAHRTGDRNRESRHPLAMALGFGVLGVERAAERFQSVVV